MKKSKKSNKNQKITLYIVWACLYVLCVGLGTLPEPEGLSKVLMVMIGIGFFVPGYWLAFMSIGNGSKKDVRILRTICICSLSLTLAAIVGNFLSVLAGATAGMILYDVLALVSAPMICCQYWALSIFLWAALLMVTIPGVILPGKRNRE